MQRLITGKTGDDVVLFEVNTENNAEVWDKIISLWGFGTVFAI